MSKKLIAFAGLKRSGKDTAAIPLIESGWHRVRFADPIKWMMWTLLGMQNVDQRDIARMIDGELKEKDLPEFAGSSPRRAMQTLGEEWGRQCMGSDFWVGIAKRRIQALGHVVVTDCRYHNEVEMIHDLGGYVVRIVRPGLPDADRHPSEALVPELKVDHEIINDGSEKALQNQVMGFLVNASSI